MKKRIAFAIGLTMALSACYDDYIKDFDYTSFYFMYKTNELTFLLGDGMSI